MPLFTQSGIQRITVIGAIADQILGFSLDHVKIKAQLPPETS